MRIGQLIKGVNIGEANIVHQDIQFAVQPAQNVVYSLLYPVERRQIRNNGNHTGSNIANGLRSSRKQLSITVEQSDGRALASKSECRGSPNATRATSNKDDLVIKPSIHNLLKPVRS